MKRQKFLQRIGLGLVAVPFATVPFRTKTGDNSDCVRTASDTSGPFETHEPATLTRADIRGDRNGIPLSIELTILDRSNGCKPLHGTLVDVWHCDNNGLYSEYGNQRMQRDDMRASHFCRGRQKTDANGKVAFQSIFPGWYPGRSTHIHIEVLTSDGDSILVTQLAFPEGPESAVLKVNATTDYKGMDGYVSNERDMVFRDGIETQLAHISGDINSGFQLTHSVVVA